MWDGPIGNPHWYEGLVSQQSSDCWQCPKEKEAMARGFGEVVLFYLIRNINPNSTNLGCVLFFLAHPRRLAP